MGPYCEVLLTIILSISVCFKRNKCNLLWYVKSGCISARLRN